MGSNIIQRIPEGSVADVLQPFVQYDVIAAVVVEGLVIDDRDLGADGKAFYAAVNGRKVRQESGVVTRKQITVFEHEFRIIFVQSNIAQRYITVKCTVAYMYKRGRQMQPLEKIVCERVITQPCEGWRKVETIAAE